MLSRTPCSRPRRSTRSTPTPPPACRSAPSSLRPRPPSARGALQPAATLEEDHEQRHCHQLGPDPPGKELLPAGDVADHPAEVLPEEAGDEGERKKHRRDDCQLLH